MTAEQKKQPKKNLAAWVPVEYFEKVKKFIAKENAKPENKSLGIKMKIREFVIKAVDEYMKKRGG